MRRIKYLKNNFTNHKIVVSDFKRNDWKTSILLSYLIDSGYIQFEKYINFNNEKVINYIKIDMIRYHQNIELCHQYFHLIKK